MKCLQVLTVLLVCAVISGCAMSRQTTTDRTAIEVALLTQTAGESIRSLAIDSDAVGERTYTIADGAVAAPEKAFILSALNDRLLSANARVTTGDNAAQMVVEPRINFAHIDDDKFLLGIPSIPIPIPGAGAFSTPEIALFGLETQKGRSQVSMYGYDSASGERLFSTVATPAEHRFRRYKFLLFFTWRTTTLPAPF